MRIESCRTIRTDDPQVLQAIVIRDAVDVVEDQRHPSASPAFTLPAHLATAPLEALIE
jgi:hypothetical protein